MYVAPDGATYEMPHHLTRPWWKSSEEYAPILDWEPTKIAWEFLRRNPLYFKAYYTWKWHRSDALTKGVSKRHPLWKLQEKLAKQVASDFGLDPDFLPASPNSSDFCPLFAEQPSPPADQAVITIDSLVNKRGHILESMRGKFHIINPGGSWPRRRAGNPVRRAHRRQQIVTYLRLLDADAAGAPSDMIRAFISCYRFLPRECAQKRLDNHRRAARRMVASGYRLLAASP